MYIINCPILQKHATFFKCHFTSAQREDSVDGVGVGDGDLAIVASDGKKRSYAATARMFKLRRNLDQLDCFHQQKEHDVLKARSGSGNPQTSWATVTP